MRFRAEKTVKVVGRLAAPSAAPSSGGPDGAQASIASLSAVRSDAQGSAMSGVLARKGFSEVLLAPEDLAAHTQLTAGRVTQASGRARERERRGAHGS